MAILGLVRNIDSAHGSKNIHGHSFRIEIELEGTVKDDMVEGIDFHDARKQIDVVLDKLDKTYLNDVIGRATVETIAAYIIKELGALPVKSVTVWESSDRYARLFKEEVL